MGKKFIEFIKEEEERFFHTKRLVEFWKVSLSLRYIYKAFNEGILTKEQIHKALDEILEGDINEGIRMFEGAKDE